MNVSMGRNFQSFDWRLQPNAEMDLAFRRMRKLFKFTEDSPKHYADKIREYAKSLKKKDKRPAHLIKDKFPEYWTQRYVLAYELWKGQKLRRVWRERATGRIVTWDVSPEDVKNVVLPRMARLETRRVDREYKKFVKVKQEKLMRPSGMPRY